MRKILLTLCLAAVMLLPVSCGEKEQAAGRTYHIYYVNKQETKIFSADYVATSIDTEELIDELLLQLGKLPDKLEYKAPLAGGYKLLGSTLQEGQLVLNFDENYNHQEPATEILGRAAIVRTLTQIRDVKNVSFQVNSEPLLDRYGNIVGVMSADMFIDNAGKEINSYEQVVLRLFFANETGDGLVEAKRQRVYNSNISMEKLVVEELIKGPVNPDPKNPEIFPTINPDTKILGVTVRDGICYVNLDDSFLLQIYNVSADVTIYSLTNSLVELPNVNKVQIAINGNTDLMFRESVNLSAIFERNLDLLKSGRNESAEGD